ncbi:hypothetical protein CHLRE_04g213400v5 [Chlamydomonas reinhardtii]|uniref:Peptidase S8/S53 domain-containing protein n=1 Tax=Chlamydomonas reinhardtii TaxID=3055 RepID=A8J9U4_CHLRE|nr:uncharacterized protein CHLRE_04g213400v5 [Chlamydomonas reinhardtii]PNW83975.1 hypothetical protein CHLRE_04g213400v5 [Chlamydomonas reinhardtii]|eukprot:XP_001698677.1 predicted protein [Chlamydomonas reinhardtii]
MSLGPRVALGLLLLAVAHSAANADRFILNLAPGAKQASLVAAIKAVGGSVSYFHAGAGIAVVTVPAGTTLPPGRLTSAGVGAVVPDSRIRLPSPRASSFRGATAATAAGDPASTSASEATPPSFPEPKLKATNLQFLSGPITSNPTDDLWDQQWAPRAIKAQSAWAAGVTGKCVRVAVLDTGMWWDHPDLAGRVDVDYARSFVDGIPPYADSQNYFWHASHVAGIVAGSANNGGIVGIAPEATIIPIKVLDNNAGDNSFLIQGLLYAASPLGPDGAGADIINLSLGGFGNPNDKNDTWALYNKVLNYVASQGVLVVAAAGNDALNLGRTRNTFVSPCENGGNTVCVSSTGPLDVCKTCQDDWINTCLESPSTWDLKQQLALYSNYGPSAISVAGPGGDYRSAFEWYAKWYDPATDSFLPGTPPTCWFVDQVLSVGAPNRPDLPAFIQYTGTSQAAPAVSGVAALMIHDAAVRQGVDLCAASRAGLKGRARGPLNVAQIKTALARGAVYPGGAVDREAYGAGLVDVSRTLGYPQPAWAAP